MNRKIKVIFEDERQIEVDYKTPAIEAVKMVQGDVNKILALNINNEVKGYDYELVKDVNYIKFIEYQSEDGYRIYSRTLKMILYMALTSLYSNANVDFIATINKDQYFVTKDMKLTPSKIEKIKEKMKEIIKKDLPIVKKVISLEEAEVLYTASNDLEKLDAYRNKLTNYISIYFCDGMYNYFYGKLAPSTGYTSIFDLVPYKDGAVLVFPDKNWNIKKDITEDRMYESYINCNKLNDIIGVKNVGQLNKAILNDKSSQIIQVCEAIHQRKMVEIALDIEKRKNVKMILIAGPSSSGKTTFAQKLGVQLRLTGYNPITISMDNYFKERVDTPLDEEGKYDFETVDALDIELFNTQMRDLIAGKTVELPEFDFYEGKKKYNGKYLKLNKNDILVVEGIHALNPILTEFTPAENKYKIYIAPVAAINMDGYTKASSSDIRLIRRMVRDYATRGHSVERTFELWKNVKRGEEKYIFPFVNTVDFVFNSSLAYETSVIKTFAQPLLLQVDKDSKYYGEARRLYEQLNYYLPMETGNVPIDSIIREFIGNGCFYR